MSSSEDFFFFHVEVSEFIFTFVILIEVTVEIT